jgi:16S rRNA G1207 methylase RsmC
VVANAFLAYGRRMEWVYRSVETVAATRQFHVFKASEPRLTVAPIGRSVCHI